VLCQPTAFKASNPSYACGQRWPHPAPQPPIGRPQLPAPWGAVPCEAITCLQQKAFSKNRERLKAERLAREAAGPPDTKAKAKAKWK
jgi:hypothetical protein